MLGLSRLVMAIVVVCVVATASYAQRRCVGEYEITGVLVDVGGTPNNAGEVYIEPDGQSKQFDRFIESTATDDKGRFTVKRYVRDSSSTLWRLYTVLDETPKTALNFVDAPFDLLRPRSSKFAGRPLRLCGTKKIDLGRVPIIHQYGVARIDLTPFAQGAEVFPDWRTTTIRIFDDSGRLAAQVDGLSENDVRQLSGSHSIDLSLPEGKWQVRIVTKGREIFVTRVFTVRKGEIEGVVPLLTT